MFKKIYKVETYKQYQNYLEKLIKVRDSYKEAYEREANSFYSNLKVVLNPTKIFNSSSKNNVHASTEPIWNTYNKNNHNYLAHQKYHEYIEKLTQFVDSIISENLTQTNKYWLNLFIKVLNEKTGLNWRAVNISARVSSPYSREGETESENYICLINETTDLRNFSLKDLENQYLTSTINTIHRNYEMEHAVFRSEHKDLVDIIVYDKAILNNQYIKAYKTYINKPDKHAFIYLFPSNRQYKRLENGIYNELWKKVLEKADEFENSLVENSEEQGEELE